VGFAAGGLVWPQMGLQARQHRPQLRLVEGVYPGASSPGDCGLPDGAGVWCNTAGTTEVSESVIRTPLA
jgi:hypothetical protein